MSLTSLSVAAQRAIETERDGALFSDPYARRLAGLQGFRLAEEITVLSYLPRRSDLPSVFALRTRFYDDRLLEATRQEGIRQVVVVGAGMDTRAYRLAWPAHTDLYEIDHRSAFDHKDSVLLEVGAPPRCRRHVVPADLREDWATPLIAHGFQPTERTAWAVEGLLYYLQEPHVHRLLSDMARLCPPESVLYTDIAPTGLRDLEQLQEWRDKLAALGEPFLFFTDDGPAVLAQYGWHATALSVYEVAAALGINYPALPATVARRLQTARRSPPS